MKQKLYKYTRRLKIYQKAQLFPINQRKWNVSFKGLLGFKIVIIILFRIMKRENVMKQEGFIQFIPNLCIFWEREEREPGNEPMLVLPDRTIFSGYSFPLNLRSLNTGSDSLKHHGLVMKYSLMSLFIKLSQSTNTLILSKISMQSF